MTTRDSNWPEGTPCWVELGVDDFDKGKAFYSRLLGWEIERGPEELGGHASCTKEGRSVAGLSPKTDPAQPTAWTTYLATEDLEVTLQRVDAAGGRLVMDPMPVGDLGAMALVTDPGGAVVGLWQGRRHTGFELANEPGAVTWTENYSRAWTHNQRFYREVFGYEYDDLPGEFEYATFKVDGQVAGGIGQIEPEMPAEMPSHWSVYFKVADVDAAVAELERMGGSVDRPAWDTEFGRIAAVADDQGAHFMLLADPRL